MLFRSLSGTAAQFMAQGMPVGDPVVLPSAAWGSILGKPAVIGAGADAAAARDAIDAGRKQVFNVKDYGAVGNGTANDTAAIQAAINAAGVAGGGQVFLPTGQYKLNATITMKSGVELAGTGSTSVLKPNFPTASPNRVIDNDWVNGNRDITLRNFKLDRSGANLSHAALFNGIENLLVDNIEISGQSMNNSGGIAVSGILDTGVVHLESKNVRVVNSHFADLHNFGIQVGYVDGCVISGNTATNASREVFGVEPEEDSIARNVTISGNVVTGSNDIIGSATGLIIATENSGGTILGCSITGNTVSQTPGGDTSNYGITVSGGDGISVTGNTVRGVDGPGIVLGIAGFNVTNGAVVQGNTVIDCGRGSGGTSPGIRLRNATRCSITGNYVYGTNHTAGVSEETGATGNMITLNYLRDTIPFTTPAVGTFVFGNKNTDSDNAATLTTGADLKLFNTSDQVTNYEQAHGHWSGNIFILNTEAGGTGTIRDIALRSGPTNGILVSAGSTKVTTTGTTGSTTGIISAISGTLSPASGTSTGLRISPTLTQTGTAGYTALLINPTETSVGSGVKNLIDAQVGGSSKFSVDNAGNVTITGTPTGITKAHVGLGSVDNTSDATKNSASVTLTNKTIDLASNTLTGTTAQFNTALSNGDFATLAGTETLTSKTFTAPKIVDNGFIADANGNEAIVFGTTASAVNEVKVSNASAGNRPTIAAQGGDTNVDLNLVSQGSGLIRINGGQAVAANMVVTLTGKTLTSPKITSGNAPATASSTGTAGQVEWDSGFVYVCTATNTWVRAALATW